MGSVPQSGRSPGEGNDNPLQYSCLENPVDRGFWRAAVHGVTKSQTRLSRHLGYLVSLNDIHNSCRFFFFLISFHYFRSSDCIISTDLSFNPLILLLGQVCLFFLNILFYIVIQVSGPIIAWQIEREKVEVVTDFLFLGSKITEDGDCSHEIRRQLLLVRKAMTNLDCVEKPRHYSTNKDPYSQGYGLPNVTNCCESWTVKKLECQRIDAFKLWF